MFTHSRECPLSVEADVRLIEVRGNKLWRIFDLEEKQTIPFSLAYPGASCKVSAS